MHIGMIHVIVTVDYIYPMDEEIMHEVYTVCTGDIQGGVGVTSCIPSPRVCVWTPHNVTGVYRVAYQTPNTTIIMSQFDIKIAVMDTHSLISRTYGIHMYYL